MTSALPFDHVKKPLTIAVVGLGSMGQRYAKIFSDFPETVIYGCDPRGDEVFTPATGWQYLSVESLVKNVTPTVAVIAVPACSHLEVLHTIKEAHPNCAVLMEKPVSDQALTPKQMNWCQNLKGLNAVGYNWRFHPLSKQLRKTKKNIRNLTLHVEQNMTNWSGSNYCDPLREFSHEIDLVQYLIEEPLLVQARQKTKGSETGYQLSGDHKRGTWAVHIFPFSKVRQRWVRVETIDGAAVSRSWDQSSETIERMYQDETQELVDAYLYDRTSETLTCSLTDALKTTRLVDEAEKLISYRSFCEGLN